LTNIYISFDINRISDNKELQC